MSLLDRQCEHTQRIGELLAYAKGAGMRVRVDSWNRTIEEQKANVAKGVSKTMESPHLDKLATDIYIVLAGAVVYVTDGSPPEHKAMYRVLGTYWESRGGRWGGRFGLEDQPASVQAVKLGWDSYHFETRNA